MITSRKVLFTAALAMGTLLCDSAAFANPSADGVAYSCDALTSASVPAVKKRLKDQGIDVSTVTGPIGLSCRKDDSAEEGVVASVTGVDGVAFRCASAEEKNGSKVVFFVDCGTSSPTTPPSGHRAGDSAAGE